MSLTTTTASADSAIMRVVEESVYGIVPDPAPAMRRIRWNSHSFGDDSATAKSSEITDSRGYTDMKRLNRSFGGSLVCEASYDSYNDFWAAVIGAASYVAGAAARTGTFATDSTTGQVTGTGVAANINVGDYVILEGFSTAVDRACKVISIADDDDMVVDPKPAATLTAAASRTVRVFDRAKQGKTLCSFLFEEEHTDISNAFFQYRGTYLNGWTFIIQDGDLPSQTFEGLGGSIVPSATTIRGSETLANTNGILGPVDDVQALVYGERGTTETFPVKRYEHRIAPNGRAERNVGDSQASGINHGKLDIEITLEMYFRSIEQYTRFVNETDLAIAIILKDKDGNQIVFDTPRVRPQDHQKPNPGQNGEIIETVTLVGLIEATEEGSFNIHTMDAA